MTKMNGMLRRRLPTVFGQGGADYACGPGWMTVFLTFCLLTEREIGKSRLKTFRLVTIKESFGTLRIRVEGGNRATWNLTVEAEEASAVTCEFCGKAGKFSLDTLGGKTVCETCRLVWTR